MFRNAFIAGLMFAVAGGAAFGDVSNRQSTSSSLTGSSGSSYTSSTLGSSLTSADANIILDSSSPHTLGNYVYYSKLNLNAGLKTNLPPVIGGGSVGGGVGGGALGGGGVGGGVDAGINNGVTNPPQCNPVPAPGAIVLGAIGMAFVGLIRKRL